MKRIITVSAILLFSALTWAKPFNRASAIASRIRDPETKYVVVACHRGDWRNFPENSIPAIESVIRMGADIMELDLKRTKDGVLVLSHDSSVLRCTDFTKSDLCKAGKSPEVKDLTFEEIRTLHLKKGHGIATDTLHMPTLKEALRVCKDRICVNVDQGFQYYEEVLAIAEELGVVDQILIKGKRSIENVAELLSGHERNLMYMPIVDFQKEKGRVLFESYMEQGVVPPAYEICWQREDGSFEEVCRRILAQGSKIWVNTLWPSLCGGLGNDDDAAFLADDPGKVYKRYLDNGVSIIQTDRPQLLLDYLKSKGRHNLKK